MMRALLLSAALLAGAVYAQSPAPQPLPQRTAQTQPPPPPPLSKEDAELVKELALLERLELVKNLDLFEQEQDGGAPKDERN